MDFLLSETLNEYKNKTLTWWGMDSLENYTSHDNLYRPEDFNYKFNEHGFRCGIFENIKENGIIYIGCSHTEGQGLPTTDTWAYKLHQKFNDISYYNLAKSGTGIEFISKTLYHYIPIFKPKYIFLQCPDYHRRNFMFNNKAESRFSTTLILKDLKDNDLFLDKSYAIDKFAESLKIVDLLSQLYNTKVIFCPLFKYISIVARKISKDNNFKNFIFTNAEMKIIDYARDSFHYGPKSHENFANDLFNKLNLDITPE